MAIWQNTNPYHDAPALLRTKDYHELMVFLCEDTPLNIFQICWLERNGVESHRHDAFHFRAIRGARNELVAVALVITNRLLLLDARDPAAAHRLGHWYRQRPTPLHHVVSSQSSVVPFWQAYCHDSSDFRNIRPRARLIQNQEFYYLTAEMLEHARHQHRRDFPQPSALRIARYGDLDALFLASARMHREETLEDPLVHDPDVFRRHVENRIDNGRSHVWINDHHRLLFKADISADGSAGVQISGVFTDPLSRGKGVATRAMFDLCDKLFADGVPLITLYVNHNNEAAKRVYTRIGFRYYADYQTIFVAV